MNMEIPRHEFCAEYGHLGDMHAKSLKNTKQEMYGCDFKMDLLCHSQNLGRESMLWLDVVLMGKFGNIGFVENVVVMLICYSNDPNNLHCLN